MKQSLLETIITLPVLLSLGFLLIFTQSTEASIPPPSLGCAIEEHSGTSQISLEEREKQDQSDTKRKQDIKKCIDFIVRVLQYGEIKVNVN